MLYYTKQSIIVFRYFLGYFKIWRHTSKKLHGILLCCGTPVEKHCLLYKISFVFLACLSLKKLTNHHHFHTHTHTHTHTLMNAHMITHTQTQSLSQSLAIFHSLFHSNTLYFIYFISTT
jgi:hypothetical protein